MNNNYQKEYYQKNKKSIKERMEDYYLKNRDNILIRTKEYVKKTNYKYEKTPQQRAIRYIKRKTRIYFPIFLCLKCKYCDNPAQLHHHTTNPIEFDKFEFVCKDCHDMIHNRILTIKEVKHGK